RPVVLSLCLLHCSRGLRAPHSFPTRRSSDLGGRRSDTRSWSGPAECYSDPMSELPTHPAPIVSAPPRRVLFLCTHNSARSQIAEGLARSVAPPGVEVWSAGGRPATAVNPFAVKVLKEAGVDTSALLPKRIDS